MDNQLMRLECVQKQLLEMLIEINRIFEEAGIRYFISFGTLLGSVRHQGFIPWDDDIDLHLHQDDKGKALEVLSENLPKHLNLVTGSVHMDWDVDFRVENLRTRILLADEISKKTDDESRLFIDFFTADKVKKACVYLHALRKKTRHVVERDVRSSVFSKWRCFFLQSVCGLVSCIPGRCVWFVNDKVSSTCFDHEDLWPLQKGIFEGYFFPIPANPAHILERLYGDYMRIPPASERRQHFYECYYIGSLQGDGQ